MELPSRGDIRAASRRIAARVRRTPVLDLGEGAFGLPGSYALKLELFQRSGSFKARGAFNLLLSGPVPDAGVAAASGGNFGLAIADAARVLGHRAAIFVPEAIAPAKLDRLRAYGAEVTVTGAVYAEALAASRRYAAGSGALLAHAYDLPEVVAGAGTLAPEVAEQVPDADTVLVAVGGGGLIGGLACWFRGDVRLVGVETDGTRTMAAAREAGMPVDVEVSGLGADALGATRVGAIGFAAAQRWVEGVVAVPDGDLVAAQRLLWESCRVLSEPASAAPLAALLAGAYQPAPGERMVLLICGANTDPATMNGRDEGGTSGH